MLFVNATVKILSARLAVKILFVKAIVKILSAKPLVKITVQYTAQYSKQCTVHSICSTARSTLYTRTVSSK